MARSRNGARARSREASAARGQDESSLSTPGRSSAGRPSTSSRRKDRIHRSTRDDALTPGGVSCSTAQRKLQWPPVAFDARASRTTDASTMTNSLYGSTDGGLSFGGGGATGDALLQAQPAIRSAQVQASGRAGMPNPSARRWIAGVGRARLQPDAFEGRLAWFNRCATRELGAEAGRAPAERDQARQNPRDRKGLTSSPPPASRGTP